MALLTWSSTLDTIDWHELAALYRAAPLGQKTAEGLKIAFTNSMFRALARDDGVLVGAGRVLADGIDTAYLCDVAVMPSHQGTGLGRQIVGQLVAASHGHRKIILYSVPGKEPFYRKLGFKRMTTAMAIFDDQPAAQARGYLDDS